MDGEIKQSPQSLNKEKKTKKTGCSCVSDKPIPLPVSANTGQCKVEVKKNTNKRNGNKYRDYDSICIEEIRRFRLLRIVETE